MMDVHLEREGGGGRKGEWEGEWEGEGMDCNALEDAVACPEDGREEETEDEDKDDINDACGGCNDDT